MSAPEPAAAARRGVMRFQRSRAVKMDPVQARRQGEITQTAFLVLGREAAIEFLNAPHAALGGRPLDVATESDAGRALVESEIGRMAYGASGDAR